MECINVSFVIEALIKRVVESAEVNALIKSALRGIPDGADIDICKIRCCGRCGGMVVGQRCF